MYVKQAEYKKAVTTNQWHRRLEFPSGETIVMHNPKVTLLNVFSKIRLDGKLFFVL